MLAGASSKGRVDRCHSETSVRAAIWGDMEGVNKVVWGDGGREKPNTISVCGEFCMDKKLVILVRKVTMYEIQVFELKRGLKWIVLC